MATIGPTPPSGCPHPHSGPRPMEAKLGDPQAELIPCPALRILINEDRLTPVEGVVSVKQLREAIKSLGVGFLPRQGLVVGATVTDSTGGLLAGLSAREFNLYHLYQGPIDHTGDTQILRGGFNQERLDNLLSYSSDGSSLTLEDLARAQKDLVDAEPGAKGKWVGAAELSALLLVFGKKDEDGKRRLSKEDLTRIYRDNRLPEGWEKPRVGATRLMATVAKFAHAQSSTPSGRAQMGLDKALGEERGVDASSAQSLRKAACPFLDLASNPNLTVGREEIAALHQNA